MVKAWIIRETCKNFELSKVTTILLTLICLLSLLGEWHWYFELISHFKLQYFLLSLILISIFAYLQKWKWLSLGVLCCLFNISSLLNWYFNPNLGIIKQEPQSLSLLLSNVYHKNNNHNDLLDLIHETNVDVLILQEVDIKWIEAIESLKTLYAYSVYKPRTRIFHKQVKYRTGIAIYSKYPLNIESSSFWEIIPGIPNIMVKLQIGDKQISLYSTHPVSPTSALYYQLRNMQLLGIAEVIKNDKNSKILVGDLNITMWSIDYANLINRTKLINSRRGFGVIPTWPTPIPLIPIDHVLVSADIKVRNFRPGRDIGSDHLPLIVDLIL